MKQLLIIGTLCITGLSACNTTAVDEIARRSSDQCYFEKITPAEISTQVEPVWCNPKNAIPQDSWCRPRNMKPRGHRPLPSRVLLQKSTPFARGPDPRIYCLPAAGISGAWFVFLQSYGINGHAHTARHFEFSDCSGVESATVMKATAQELGLVVIDP